MGQRPAVMSAKRGQRPTVGFAGPGEHAGKSGSGVALADGLFYALAWPVDAERRHLGLEVFRQHEVHRLRQDVEEPGGNLASGPMNMIREDPANPNVLYACNDFGVYVLTQTVDIRQPSRLTFRPS